ncbi:glycosyltransferase [Kytococcus sedentarius]|uniref:glycosyltransferase n=1 Tax=Kytococcus sedentarius TaxID=1276 RepID=UPI0035BC3475
MSGVEGGRRPRVTIVSLKPYRTATRARKSAMVYKAFADVTLLTLSTAGRSGAVDEAGEFQRDGITIVQAPVGTLRQDPTIANHAMNVMTGYAPGFGRIAKALFTRKHDIVHTTGAPLFLLGWLDATMFGKRWVADVTERPAASPVKVSLMSVFSKVEPLALGLARQRAHTVMSVCAGHADILRDRFQIENPISVRNAPTSDWVSTGTPRPRSGGPLRLGIISSIFESRGFEPAIQAVAIAHREGVDLTLHIYGPGRESYIAQLEALAREEQVADRVTFKGLVDSSKVSETYRQFDLALALYEATNEANDSLSNKIIEAVASGVPVLAGNLSENMRFLNEIQAGWAAPVEARALADFLVNLTDSELTAKQRAATEVAPTLRWEQEFTPVVERVLA